MVSANAVVTAMTVVAAPAVMRSAGERRRPCDQYHASYGRQTEP